VYGVCVLLTLLLMQIYATETMLTVLEAFHDFFFVGFQHFSSYLPSIEKLKETIDELVCAQ
jgi:hypothetical protein